jgi:hypothetical protein
MEPGPADAPPNTNDQHEEQQLEGENTSLTMPSTSEDLHSMEPSASLDQTRDSEDREDVEDEKDFSDDESVSVQHEDLTPTPLPMPDMTEFDVPLPPELLPVNTHEVDDVQSTADATPQPLASPPSVLHVPELLKAMESPHPGPSFEGIQVVHLGREAGLTGTMQATYFRLPPGTRTTRMHGLLNSFFLLIEFMICRSSNFTRSRRSATRRQSHLLHFRPRDFMAKWLDISFRNYGCRRMERRNRDRAHDH